MYDMLILVYVSEISLGGNITQSVQRNLGEK